jgi:hypothetical protein
MKTDLTICYVETDEGKDAALLESAKISGVQLHRFGLGEPWEGFLTKTKIFIRELKKLDTRYVMCLDSRDVLLFHTSAHLLLERYLTKFPDKKCVFNGETNCYPHKPYESLYESTNKYRFLNSGCFIGSRMFLLAMFEYALEYVSKNDEYFPEDDQHLYTTIFLQDQNHLIAIDENCEIFQTLWDEHGGRSANFDVVYTKDMIWNQHTETYPMIFHYPGPTGHGETVKKIIRGKYEEKTPPKPLFAEYPCEFSSQP